MQILVNAQLTEDQLREIAAVDADLALLCANTQDERIEHVGDAEVVFGGFNRELFENARRLRWVQVLSAGVDGLLFPEFVESDVILTSAKGFVGPHLADQTWALILGLLRGVGRSVRERTWDNRWEIREATWELDGKTLGIMGLGGTGIEVARRAPGFGMRVIAVDPEDVERPSFVDEVWSMARLHDLLRESDVVAICAPLTVETHGIFDAAAFAAMKPHALLTNVTRGKIVDGPSLIHALQEGEIGGAGLDVTPEEPLPDDSPLWDLPHAIVTPHVAGGSPVRMDRAVGLFCDNLCRYVAGEPLLSVIDKRKGY